MRSRFAALVSCLLLAFATGCSSSASSSTPTPPESAQLSLSATSISFAATTVGQTSAAQTLTLTNSGSIGLSFSSSTLSDTADYGMMTTCGASLGASSTCMVTLTFTPKSAASFPATLTFVDSVSSSPQTVTLSGQGSAIPAASVLLSSTTLTFPSITALSPAPTQTITLTNSGNAALAVSSIALSGTGAGSYTTSNNCGASVPAASSCTISVIFTPAAASTTYIATLTVTDNSGNMAGSTQTVALSGSGAAPLPVPQAVLSPTSLTFPGTAPQTAAAPQTVTLSNPGSGTLTGISASIGGGTSATSFSLSSTCVGTLAAGASCTLTVGFTPASSGTYAATLSVADNASTTPQTVALSGSGIAPVATFSAATITFPATTINTTSGGSGVTLTNTGSAALSIGSIVLGGANAADFTQSSNCGAMLAPGASCSIAATFTPAAAATYNATFTVTDNAAGSPQVITLTGSGTAAAVTHTLYAFPETDLSITPLYALINAAQTSIDMTMYELVDTTFSGDLVAACNRGVTVRVILDQSLEKSSNTPAYNQLNAVAHCSAAWSNTQFQATHEKSFVIDGTMAAILSLNLTSRYYSTTRDFALIENDTADIAAIEATFNTDFGSTTDLSYQPPAGDDLIWSPTTATTDLLGIINGATKTLLVENEEMSATNIVSALESACKRGVTVQIAMTDTGSYHANYSALEAAGCGVHVYADNATTLYIHAKALVADLGLPTQSVYMGSINFSTASLTENRELGLYISDQTSVQSLASTMSSDYAGAPAY
jgi:cardiolipin synthase